MHKTIFDRWPLSPTASQQDLLELFQEKVAIAKLEGDFSEEEYYEVRQILEDPLLLFTHRFFSVYPLDEAWEQKMVQQWKQQKIQEEEHLLSDQKAFMLHYWKSCLPEEMIHS